MHFIVSFFLCIFIWIYRDKNKCGIVPKSYIHILDCVLTTKNEYFVKRTAIVDEITTVLCEWGNLFKRFYLTNHEVFQPIRHKILELIGLRSQILSGNLPVDEMKQVKLMATSEIDTGNKLLGKQVVNFFFYWGESFLIHFVIANFGWPNWCAHDKFIQIDCLRFVNKIACRFGHGCSWRKWQYFGYNNNINDTTLWTPHLCSWSNTKSNGKFVRVPSFMFRFALHNSKWVFDLFYLQSNFNKNRLSKTTNKHSHNLMVTVHAFVCKHQEDSDLLLTLYDGDEMKAITENYVVKWGRQGLARDLDQFDNHRVLFTVSKHIHI